MSRTAAEKQFTEADMVKQTKGVIFRKDKGVIDEISGAYKDIDEVMENQRDVIEIPHTEAGGVREGVRSRKDVRNP